MKSIDERIETLEKKTADLETQIQSLLENKKINFEFNAKSQT